jgi:hypothetical protein
LIGCLPALKDWLRIPKKTKEKQRPAQTKWHGVIGGGDNA